MQGYLEKQTSGVLFRKFQQRYFLQQRSLLVYYPRREDIADCSDPKHIDLSHCIGVGLTEGDTSAREFWIELPERTFWFRAPNTADRDCWIANLFVFNGAQALDAFPIARHVYVALMDVLTTLTGEAGDVEGLFRVPGDKHIIERTCDAIYRCRVTEALSAKDITVYELSSVLKKLLRQLPESLLTQELILPFTSTSATAESLRDLVEKLPMLNRDILMKLAVLLHKQIQKAAITKASVKSLSILLGPCLSTNPEAPFLDVNKLITLIVEHGSIVFGYSFSRAIALQANLSDSSTASLAKYDPWVNQELQKEVMVTVSAEPHLTEIEPINDIGIEAEHFAPSQPEQQDESRASHRSDNDVPMAVPEKALLTPLEPIRNATMTIPIQSQFQAQEFGFSSGSELTPRDDDQLDDDLPVPSSDAVQSLQAVAFRPSTPSDRAQSLSQGQSNATAQRRHILSMGNTNESEYTDSQSTSSSARMRKLSIAQGRSRILQTTASNSSDCPPVSDGTRISESNKRSVPSQNVLATKTTFAHIFQDRTEISSNNAWSEKVIHPIDEDPSATVSVQQISSRPTISSSILDSSYSTTKNAADASKNSVIPASCTQTETQLPKNESVISQPDEEAPTPLQLEDCVPSDIDSEFHKASRLVSQQNIGEVLNATNSVVRSQSGNPLKDGGHESGGLTTTIQRDIAGPSKNNLFFADSPSSGLRTPTSTFLEKHAEGAVSVIRGRDSETKHEAVSDMFISRLNDEDVDGQNNFSSGILPSDKKLNPILKEDPGKSTNSDMRPSRDRHRKITSSTQTAQGSIKDSSTQTRKSKLEPEMKEMLETAQRQILDYKERLSHYQKKCKSLEQAMESQAQASALLQEHNTSLQAKNRALFQEQDSLNSDLEEALLQLEQARQQIKMQTAINANLTAALSQQKLQHEAIVTSLENQNQAAIAQSCNPVAAFLISSKVAEASENSENMNIMLKKRLNMMRSRVQSRLHNSRENLASIESRAIIGLTESKQRIHRLQMELQGFQS